MRTTRTITEIATERAKLANVPVDVVVPYVEAEVRKHPFRIEYDSLPHTLELAEVVDITGEGGIEAHWLTFNLRHSYVEKVMLADWMTPYQRSALEVTLAIVLGANENPDSNGHGAAWARERHVWSTRLEAATRVLTDFDPKTGENLLGEVEGQAEWKHEDDEP